MKVQDLTKRKIDAYRNGKKVEVDGVVIFKALQYRWEDSADPETEDVDYFLTKETAVDYAQKIDLEVGFLPKVEEISIELDAFEADEEFELEELDDHFKYGGEAEDVWTGDSNDGDDIAGAVIIEWSWEKYVGYARNLVRVGMAGEWPFQEFSKESDLISGNEDRTFRSNYSVLLTPEEVKASNDLQESIDEALNADHWKWNYFKNNPNTAEYHIS